MRSWQDMGTKEQENGGTVQIADGEVARSQGREDGRRFGKKESAFSGGQEKRRGYVLRRRKLRRAGLNPLDELDDCRGGRRQAERAHGERSANRTKVDVRNPDRQLTVLVVQFVRKADLLATVVLRTGPPHDRILELVRDRPIRQQKEEA